MRGQNRPDLPGVPTFEKISSLRSGLAEKVAASDIDVGLSVTIYRDYFDRLSSVVDYVLNSRHINTLFATNYVDTDNVLRSIRLTQRRPGCPGDDNDAAFMQPGRTTNQQIYDMLK